ncbi:MAG TPA: LysR family transcriptional regulator [Rhizomicrobium sp.]
MPGEASRADWNDYRVFATVARTGSFRGASRTLKTSPQAVSMRIANLEDRLGRRLLNRLTHGVELTREGERVLGFVQAAESSLARAASVACDPSDAIEGECRLSLGDGMATYWFPRFLAAFGKTHPRIALYPYSSTARTMTKSPSHDIQVQYTDTPDETLVASHVATLHFLLFASREYLDECGTPKSVEDLAKHRFVDFTLADSDKGTFASLRGLPDRTLVITNSIGTQCEAMRWGAGIGMLPSYASLVHTNLVPVLQAVRFPMPVHLCFEREAAKRPAVRATLNFLKDVVFDRTRMPWFTDDFVQPEPHWEMIFHDCIGRNLNRSA